MSGQRTLHVSTLFGGCAYGLTGTNDDPVRKP